MIKVAYLQCPTGISGDMCLGAIISSGVPIAYLINKLNNLGIAAEYKLWAELVVRKGQQATQAHVELIANSHNHQEHHRSRHLPEIEQIILQADLPSRAKTWSLKVFRNLAIAEGAVHGISPEKVYFHEIGAVDAIVDIVGTCLGLDFLGISSNLQGLPMLYCSPLPTGGGMIKTAHGIISVPVPAVLKLWEMRGCPIYGNGIAKELVTPTGAAIAMTLAVEFGEPPRMTISQIGLGTGQFDLQISNILQLWLGEVSEINSNAASNHLENISILETQLDDLNPQAIGYVFEALFAVGAVDVFTQQIGMKKCRPGLLLTVICHPEDVYKCEQIVFRETTTLGIRCFSQKRAVLRRETQDVKTKYGVVRIKVAWQGEEETKDIINIQPEYEDCAKLARQNSLAWKEIWMLALHHWYLQQD